jgi:hypothetical protein
MHIRGLGLLRRVFRAPRTLWDRLAGGFWRRVLPMLAPLVHKMATTGMGTDACLKRRCLPMPVHYYSPVPDVEDLRERKIWSRRSDLAGVDMREDAQVTLLKELGKEFGEECVWPAEPTGDPTQFFTNNSGFSYGCAAGTHMIVRRFKPRRVIEIGSGSSSRVLAAALCMNAQERPHSMPEYTVVDPYPAEGLQSLPGLTRLLRQRVELLDFSTFLDLQANDVLFIDSGHTVRIGGDVNFLILDILPRLAPGVVVHFHDIPMPYEYAEVYCTNHRFRMFWTESYLLQAFLSLNDSYEVLLAMNYLMTDRPEVFRAALRHYLPRVHGLPSHSFWIRRSR